MKCKKFEFDARERDAFRKALAYNYHNSETTGKTSANEDVVNGRFAELVRGEKVVELIEFETDDMRFSATMKITTTLTLIDTASTDVTVTYENVAAGMSKSDHIMGITSSLDNLAAFVGS